ncbi:MAG: hypothetical protein Q9M36_00130 [Sulfurovum sp.]|nr:hypothetical protein [Sulfurovum sp.]
MAIASKYPISKLETLSVTSPSFVFARKPIKALVTLPNAQELLVYVCHLKSNRLNEFEYIFDINDNISHKKALVSKAIEDNLSNTLAQRLHEASALFGDIAQSQDKPSLLLCDLNDKEFSLSIDALANPQYYDDTSSQELLLYDAYYQHKPQIYNPHPEAKAPKRKPTSYFVGKGNVLDYIFVSKDFKVVDYEVLDAHLQDNTDGSLLTSDHAQVARS